MVKSWTWDHRAERELSKLHVAAQAKLLEIVKRYLAGESRQAEVKPMIGSPGLWEVRARAGNGWPRILFHKNGDECRALTVFMKKSNQTSKEDLERAKGRM